MAFPLPTPLLDTIRLFEDFQSVVPSREEFLHRWRQNFDAAHSAKSQPPREMKVDVVLTPEQAAGGGALPIEFPVARICPRCDGTGSTGFYRCDQCDGHGLEWRRERIDVLLPRPVRDGMVISASLAEMGVRNFYLRVRVCVAPVA
jgi:DnaJ-class molecular chaperone